MATNLQHSYYLSLSLSLSLSHSLPFSLSPSLSLSTLPFSMPPFSLFLPQSPPSSRGPPTAGGLPMSSVGTSSGLLPGHPPPPLLYSNPALHLSSDIAALMPAIQGFGSHSLLGGPAGLGSYSPTQPGADGPPHSDLGERDHHGDPRSGSPGHDTD